MNISTDQNHYIRNLIILTAVLIVLAFSCLKFSKLRKSQKPLPCKKLVYFATPFDSSSNIKQLLIRQPAFLMKKCVSKTINNTNVLVVSYASPSCDYCSYPMKQLQLYCDMHGYQLKVFKESLMPSNLNPHLEKIFIMQKLLSTQKMNTVIVWIDSDIVIVDFSRRLDPFFTALEKKLDFLISQDGTFDDPSSFLNAGIYFVKNTITMRLFFNNALKLAKQSATDEQGLKESLGILEVASFVQQKTVFAPTSLMQVYCFPCTMGVIKKFMESAPFAVNFAGVKADHRKKLILMLLQMIPERKTTNQY